MSKKAVEILSGAGFTVDVKTGHEAGGAGGGDRPVPRRRHPLGQQDRRRTSLANPGKLKIIGRAGVGVDNIDVKAATEKGILVINTPQGNAAAAAELAIGLHVRARAQDPAGRGAACGRAIWEKKKFMGAEIAGKTLGVVGLGNIGRQAAERGVGLKMNVIGFDPFPPTQLPAGVKVVTLRRAGRQVRLHHAARAADARDQEPVRRGDLREDEEGRLPDQLRARRHRRRGRGARGAEVGTARRRGAGRVRQGAARAVAAVRAREPDRRARTWARRRSEAQEKVAIELAEVFVGFLKDGIVRNAVKYGPRPNGHGWSVPLGHGRDSDTATARPGCAITRPRRRPRAGASSTACWRRSSGAGSRASSRPRSNTRTCWRWASGTPRARRRSASSSRARARWWRCGPTSRRRSRASSRPATATSRGPCGSATKGRWCAWSALRAGSAS